MRGGEPVSTRTRLAEDRLVGIEAGPACGAGLDSSHHSGLDLREEGLNLDVALNPIRAKVSLGLRVMTTDDLGFDHRGGGVFINHLRTREALAGKTGAASLQSLGLSRLPL